MHRLIATLAAGGSFALALAMNAQAATWTATGNGNWHDAGNWSGGVPNGTGAAADFTADIAADLTVTLNSPATVGNLTIADGGSAYFSYSISHATNTLTFDDSDTTAGLTVSRGTANLISAPVALSDNLSVAVSNASRAEISGTLSGAGQLQVTRADMTTTAFRLSADNSAWAGGIQLSGGGGAAFAYGNYYSTPLEIAHAKALGSGTIITLTGGNFGYGGELSNQTGSVLTVNNNINGRMKFTGDGFILNGTLTFTNYSIAADVTFPTGLPAGDKVFDAAAVTGKTVKLLTASAGNLTSVTTGGGSGNLRIEFHHDDAFGTDLTKSISCPSEALTLVAANGPRTLSKNFSAGWIVDGPETLTLAGNTTAGYAAFKKGTGLLILTGSTTLTSRTAIYEGVLRAASANALSSVPITLGYSGSNGGILELTPQAGDFTRPVASSGAGTVRWENSSSGGFSAYGGDRFVNLGGVSAQLVWGPQPFVTINSQLILSSIHADSVIDFQNPIDLTGGGQGAGNRRVLVNDNPNTTADYAVMSGVITSTHTAAGLIKQGDGKLVLTAPNTYIGQTQVTAGTLLVNATHTGGAAYTVSPGATLGGTGTIGIGANTATWQAGTGPEEANRGGRVAPGASIGTLTLNGHASLQNYTVYVADLNATTLQADLLQVNGNLTLGANLIVKLGDWIGDPTGQSFTFLTYTGTLTGSPVWTVDTAGTGWTGGSVSQAGQTFVLGGLVPEPATLGLLVLGGLVLLGRRGRRV